MPRQPTARAHEPELPPWSQVLRALREMRGVTQDGWAAWLGVGRRTVVRWERGDAVPDAGAEAAIIAVCCERGLFRTVDLGPLGRLTITADLLTDLLGRARLGMVAMPDSPATEESIPAASTDRRTNLPAPVSSLIGREREIPEGRRLLAATRLLTLTGTGGVGKTRLALEIAHAALEEFPDGVWLVELAALADPALVARAIAIAVGVRDVPGEPLLATVGARLRSAVTLIVLDNCEHLALPCAEAVESLLQQCPQLRVLATSRTALGINGETIWRVPSLSLPGSTALPSPEQALRHGAVRLFVERARASEPRFQLTEENVGAAIEVCRRLDGIPLAIELAAARMRVLSVEQITTRLDECFRLLTSGSPTARPRHQTLRAAFDWSHDLLSDPERMLFRRLAVFPGSFTLDAAEAVCGAGDSGQRVMGAAGSSSPTAYCPLPAAPEYDALDLLSRLIDHSLVSAEYYDRAARYRLLETARQYARERLHAAGEEVVIGGRHRDWYLALAERAEPELTGAAQQTWMEALETEHDNLRAALAWSLEGNRDPERGLRLSGALWRFWDRRGYLGEGRGWLERALVAAERAPAPVRLNALDGAVELANNQGDYARALELSEQTLSLRRALGDLRGVAMSLNHRGIAAKNRGDYAAARADLDAALLVRREIGESRGIAVALTGLGNLALTQSDDARAAALYEEALTLYRAAGDRRGVGIILLNLGAIALGRSRLDRAEPLYAEALALLHTLGDTLAVVTCLEGMAAVAGMKQDSLRAARLYGAAERLRAVLGSALSPANAALYRRYVEAARRGASPEAFQAAWREGCASGLEEIITFAFKCADSL